MKTKFHMFQPFVVEVGHVSVMTDAFLGAASCDARLLADFKTIPVLSNI